MNCNNGWWQPGDAISKKFAGCSALIGGTALCLSKMLPSDLNNCGIILLKLNISMPQTRQWQVDE